MSEIKKQWCATCNDWREHGTWQHEGKSELAAPGSSQCGDCKREYPWPLDVLLPDEQWKKICPVTWDGNGSGGLLCPECIVKRGSELPGVTVARLHFE